MYYVDTSRKYFVILFDCLEIIIEIKMVLKCLFSVAITKIHIIILFASFFFDHYICVGVFHNFFTKVFLNDLCTVIGKEFCSLSRYPKCGCYTSDVRGSSWFSGWHWTAHELPCPIPIYRHVSSLRQHMLETMQDEVVTIKHNDQPFFPG